MSLDASNPPALPLRSGGRIVVDALRAHGVDTLFSVPGESFLPVLDALYDMQDSIRLVTCRHEANAGHMAEAYGKLRGQPGVCLVTRGPGSTHASVAIHTARQDSTPLVVLVGQVGRHALGRETWQELDYPAVFGSLCKWVAQVDRIERLPELLSRAFHVATSGRPGPVMLALPEDLLYEQARVQDVAGYTPVRTCPGAAALHGLRSLLEASSRPLVLLGGGGWTREASLAMQGFAQRWNLPVCTGFRRQDLFDNRDPHYVGDLGLGADPALAARVREADLIVCVGSRLGETTTADYSLLQVPRPRQRLVHVHADASELGRVYQADLLIHADPAAFCEALADWPPLRPPPWADWTAAARAGYRRYQQPQPMAGELNLSEVVLHLREVLPDDSIVSNGAGNYAGWVHRFFTYTGLRTQLAPTSGAMGYGLPAACAAAIAEPGRTVVCFAGDGCLQMSLQELATVQELGLKLIVIVVNNGIFGSIRMHQEMQYPGRVLGTDLASPDFVALARAYGLAGERVQRTADFPAALARALAADRASLIELVTDPEAITPRSTLSGLRARALERIAAAAS